MSVTNSPLSDGLYSLNAEALLSKDGITTFFLVEYKTRFTGPCFYVCSQDCSHGISILDIWDFGCC